MVLQPLFLTKNSSFSGQLYNAEDASVYTKNSLGGFLPGDILAHINTVRLCTCTLFPRGIFLSGKFCTCWGGEMLYRTGHSLLIVSPQETG